MNIWKGQEGWMAKESGWDEVVIGTSKELFKYLIEGFDLERFIPITLKEGARRFSMPYSTLAQAVREGRVSGRREVGTWLTTENAIQEAIDDGHIRG